jgi:release factor glutamine methyltransferase
MPRDTVLSLLRKSALFLEEKGIAEPRPSAEILLCLALLCKRIDLYLRFDQPVNDAELELYRSYIRRRLKGEPVQYIVGETEFYGLPLRVNPDVLIPRPETEHVVEAGLAACKRLSAVHERVHALDIGTGSGAIAIALAAHVQSLECLALDVSEAALRVAAQNAVLNGVDGRIRFLRWDILGEGALPPQLRFHLIVSNPPYIPLDEIPTLQVEVREYEPRVATTDGADGLSFYRRIAELAPEYLEPDGRLVLELGHGQLPDVRGFMDERFHAIDVLQDYAGIDRVLIASQPK